MLPKNGRKRLALEEESDRIHERTVVRLTRNVEVENGRRGEQEDEPDDHRPQRGTAVVASPHLRAS